MYPYMSIKLSVSFMIVAVDNNNLCFIVNKFEHVRREYGSLYRDPTPTTDIQTQLQTLSSRNFVDLSPNKNAFQ